MKKVDFKTIKTGNKFAYGNSLYIMDTLSSVVNFTSGKIEPDAKFKPGVMVVPIYIRASEIIKT